MAYKFRYHHVPISVRLEKILNKLLMALLYTIVMVLIVLTVTYIQKEIVHTRPLGSRDQNTLENFIEWYAVIYTLTLSLIISNSWIRFNRINSEIDREADELSLLVQVGKMSGNKHLSDLLSRAVKIYVNYVRNIRGQDERVGVQSGKRMETISACVSLMTQDSDIDNSVKSALLNHFAQATDARSDRFDLLGQALPLRIWVLLAVFSLAWIWGFFWIEFDVEPLRFYICTCTVFSVTILFGYAMDLDDPTRGFWQIDFTPFIENKF